MKYCSKCKTSKKLSEFSSNKSRKDGHHHLCKECYSKYQRQWYQENKEIHCKRVRRRNKRVAEENKEEMIKYLKSHPCVDCGEADILVLDFDHLANKTMDVGRMVFAAYSWKRILKEIEKCEVVCANCHRRRTAKRQGSYKFLGA